MQKITGPIDIYEDTFVQDMLAKGWTEEALTAAMAPALDAPAEPVEMPENPEWSGFASHIKS